MKKSSMQIGFQKLPKYTFSVIWAIVILVMCVVDFSETSEKLPVFEGLDKIIHGLMYFILTILAIWEFHRRKNVFSPTQKEKRLFWIALLLPLVYGGFIEIVQGYLSYRGKETFDLVADAIGSLFAFLLYDIVLLYKTKKS